MEQITTAFTEGVGTIASDATGVVASVLPIALPVMGIGIAIALALKYTKKVTKG